MRTISQTILATLSLAALLGVGAAQAQEFPGAALASRAPAASSNAPSAGASQFAEFPRSTLLTTVLSASNHVSNGGYALMAEFPGSAVPVRATPSAPALIARVLPQPAIPQAHAYAGGSGPNG